jgi:hypothetical protein
MSREVAERWISFLPESIRVKFAPARLNPEGYFPQEDE